MKDRFVEVTVGFFILSALLAMMFLAYRVSDFGQSESGGFYQLSAEFDNIGNLKVRAPVAVAGVKVGEITAINVNPDNFRAVVKMKINKKYDNIPVDSSANIFTQGILGSNYVSLTPGFEQNNLQGGGHIETTHSAVILENIIGQIIYGMKGNKNSDKEGKANNTEHKNNGTNE